MPVAEDGSDSAEAGIISHEAVGGFCGTFGWRECGKDRCSTLHLDSRPLTSCGANEFRLHGPYDMQNERRLQFRRDVSSIETSQTQPGKRNKSLARTYD
jgi:hypothetical protein